MTAVIAIASRDPVNARNSLIGNPFVGDDTSHSPLKGPPETVTNPGYHPPRPQTPATNIAEGTKHVRFAEHTPQPTRRTALTKLDALQSELLVDSFTPSRSVLTVEEHSVA